MKTLKYDHTLQYDEDVEYLQICLNYIRKKFNGVWNALDEDGRFGNNTKDAVSGFQRFADLVVDGTVGEKTWARIEEMMDYTPMLSGNKGIASRYSGGTTHYTPSNSGKSSSSKNDTPQYTPAPTNTSSGPARGLSPDDPIPSHDSNAISIIVAAGNLSTGAVGTGATGVSATATMVEKINKKGNSSIASKAGEVSKRATKAGGVFLAADIALSGEIKPSHFINGTMLGVSGTGVGAVVAGAWFIADYGTMGFNRIVNGEWRSLSDIIDEAAEEKVGKFELYEGFY